MVFSLSFSFSYCFISSFSFFPSVFFFWIYSDSWKIDQFSETLSQHICGCCCCFSHVWLWDPADRSPPGSPVPGILQARTLEWGAISFSKGWNWKVKVKSFSRVQLLATPWTVANQAPLSMGFSRQEYWSGVPLPSPQHVYQYQSRNIG